MFGNLCSGQERRYGVDIARPRRTRATTRIAGFTQRMVKRLEARGIKIAADVYPFPLTQTDIADATGLDAATTSIVQFNNLRADRIIDLSNDELTILNSEKFDVQTPAAEPIMTSPGHKPIRNPVAQIASCAGLGLCGLLIDLELGAALQARKPPIPQKKNRISRPANDFSSKRNRDRRADHLRRLGGQPHSNCRKAGGKSCHFAPGEMMTCRLGVRTATASYRSTAITDGSYRTFDHAQLRGGHVGLDRQYSTGSVGL